MSPHEAVFREIDVDGNGQIDAAELFTAINKLYPEKRFTPGDVQSMIQEADMDSDGTISLDEYLLVVANPKKQSLWSVLTDIGGVAELLHATTQPLRALSHKHAFLCPETGAAVATVGLRLAAELASTVVIGALAGLVSVAVTASALAAGRFHGKFGFNSFQYRESLSMDIFVFCIIIALPLQVRCWLKGQTLGMSLFGLHVVDKASHRPVGILQMLAFDPLAALSLLLRLYMRLVLLEGQDERAVMELGGRDKALYMTLDQLLFIFLLARLAFTACMFLCGRWPTELIFGTQVVVKK